MPAAAVVATTPATAPVLRARLALTETTAGFESSDCTVGRTCQRPNKRGSRRHRKRPRPPLREQRGEAAAEQQLLGERGADRDAQCELVERAPVPDLTHAGVGEEHARPRQRGGQAHAREDRAGHDEADACAGAEVRGPQAEVIERRAGPGREPESAARRGQQIGGDMGFVRQHAVDDRVGRERQRDRGGLARVEQAVRSGHAPTLDVRPATSPSSAPC